MSTVDSNFGRPSVQWLASKQKELIKKVETEHNKFLKVKYKSHAYWMQYIRLELYNFVRNKSAEEVAHILNIGLDEAQSILNGDWDGKASDLIRFSFLLK